MTFNIIFFPFMVAFMLIAAAIVLLVTAFWIWMIVDCVQRKFKNETEKVIWILAVILLTWVGALVYYFAIRASNPQGLSKHSDKKKKRK